MEKNFINFHVLISHSPSCLNRDDMNMQKDTVFGGKRRVRISSQSLKRSLRKSAYYQQHLGESSIRTRQLGQLKEHFIAELSETFSAELIEKAIQLISGKELPKGDDKWIGDAVAPWVLSEFSWFCQKISETEETDIKKLGKAFKEHIIAMNQTLNNGVDVALSGRMATSGLMSEIGKVDGAMAVAHAITTHSVDSDIDWFTAVDDLQELGSGHLDTQEFSSGVFYRYASLNIAQLQQNLGGVDRATALDIAAHLAHMLATEVPSAKQNSFAAFNPADVVMISFSDLPISLANAFERPVKADDQGFLIPSVKSLQNYWQRIHQGYGLDERCAGFTATELTFPPELFSLPTMPALESWIRADGRE